MTWGFGLSRRRPAWTHAVTLGLLAALFLLLWLPGLGPLARGSLVALDAIAIGAWALLGPQDD